MPTKKKLLILTILLVFTVFNFIKNTNKPNSYQPINTSNTEITNKKDSSELLNQTNITTRISNKEIPRLDNNKPSLASVKEKTLTSTSDDKGAEHPIGCSTPTSTTSTDKCTGELINSDNISPLFTVTQIVDGDTFKADIEGKIETIRLIGINTPESVDPRRPVECFGIQASNHAKDLLTNQQVRLEADPTQSDRDKYGRLLRYAWLTDGTFYNEKMITDGYAYEYTYRLPYKYQVQFKQAQITAQTAKVGLWADNVCSK